MASLCHWSPFLNTNGMSIKKGKCGTFFSECPNTEDKSLLGGFLDPNKIKINNGLIIETEISCINDGRAISFFLYDKTNQTYFTFYILRGHVFALVKKLRAKDKKYGEHIKEIMEIINEPTEKNIENWYRKLSSSTFIRYAIVAFWFEVCSDHNDYDSFNNFISQVKVKKFEYKYRLTYKDLERTYDYDKWLNYPNYSQALDLLKWKVGYYHHRIHQYNNNKHAKSWQIVAKADRPLKLSFKLVDSCVIWMIDDYRVYDYSREKCRNLHLGFGISSGFAVGKMFNFTTPTFHNIKEELSSDSDEDISTSLYCHTDDQIDIPVRKLKCLSSSSSSDCSSSTVSTIDSSKFCSSSTVSTIDSSKFCSTSTVSSLDSSKLSSCGDMESEISISASSCYFDHKTGELSDTEEEDNSDSHKCELD